MENEEQKASANTKGAKRKTVGGILTGIAVVVLFIAIMCEWSYYSCNGDYESHMGEGIIGLFGLIISLPTLAAGIALLVIRSDVPPMATAALLCGIFSFAAIPFGSILAVIGLLLSLLAIIFGAGSLMRLKKNSLLGGRKVAISGLMLGIIVFAAAIYEVFINY